MRRSPARPKIGGSVLEIGPIHPCPGGDLAATIHVERPIPGGQPVVLRLRCIQRNRHIGGSGSTTKTVLWQEAQTLDPLPGSAEGTDIPVRFHIPDDKPITTGFGWGGSEVTWSLEARSKSILVNYFARFRRASRPGRTDGDAPAGAAPAHWRF